MEHPLDSVVSFFVNDVDPTVREFMGDRGNVRRARLAAIMLVHMADHFWHGRPSERVGTVSEEAFRASIARGNADFRLLCDVCNVSKHAVLRPRRAGQPAPLVSDASQVEERRFWSGSGAALESPAMSGPWGSARELGPPLVVAAMAGEASYPLSDAAWACHVMWCGMLALTLPLPPLG